MRAAPSACVLAACAACAFSACAPTVRPWDTEIVVPVAPAAATLPAAAPAPPAPPPPSSTCTRTLRLDVLAPETKSCQIHGLAAGDETTLVLPCTGDGEATARFPKYTMTGAVSRGVLHLVHDRTEEFKDGCKWRFTQRVRGETAGGDLTYEYEEDIVEVRGSCYSPCGGTGEVSLR